jgi:hypothetical protein
MSKHHTVKIHNWVSGLLYSTESFFNSIEDAMSFAVAQTTNHANNSDAHNIKIYNENGEIVHHVSSQTAASTYA